MARRTVTATMPGTIGALGDTNATDWKAGLLQAMGAPVTPANLKALELWHTSEGTNPSTYNWLAISDGANRWPHGACLAQCGSSSPIYAFPSQAVGVQATAAFLRGSYYTAVVDAFRNNAGLAGIFQAINASPWCRGCQSGRYPNALYQGINGPLALNPDAGTGPSSPGGTSTPVADKPADANPCLLGGGDALPSFIPFGQSVPCLLYKSWGDAILGALVLVAGGVLMLAGVALLAGASDTVKGAVGTVARRGGGSSSSPIEPSVSDVAGADGLDVRDVADYKRFVLDQQEEAASRPAPSVRTVKAGGTTRNATSHAGAGRARARSMPRTVDVDEEPF